MKKYFLFLLLITLFLGPAHGFGQIQSPTLDPSQEQLLNAEKITEATWEVEHISEEITWKRVHLDDLFSSRQFITVFEVDLTDPDVAIAIPHVSQDFIKTSEAAESGEAIAAINGSFFNTKTGGSTVFFKKEGNIINQTQDGFTWYRENAAFGLDVEGKPLIVEKPKEGWASLDAPTLLASGPMLIMEGDKVQQVDQPFNQHRHPRTAIGLTKDNKLIAVVVDGRASEAHGMSIAELAELMSGLGCISAMNLDGGGSSTAWISKEGVVNHPSDNKQFDHQGERGVATVINFLVKQ